MAEASTSLRTEALEVIQDLSLMERLRPFGQTYLVGSVAMDLVVKPDIDLNVLVKEPDLLVSANAIYPRLLECRGIHHVRISDYRPEGVKIGIDGYPGPIMAWDIDIWVTNDTSTLKHALVERINRELDPERRQAILNIKRYYYQLGQLRNGLSMRIYLAVLERGVRTPIEFERVDCGR